MSEADVRQLEDWDRRLMKLLGEVEIAYADRHSGVVESSIRVAWTITHGAAKTAREAAARPVEATS